MRFNDQGETIYSEFEAKEIEIALKAYRSSYKINGQNVVRPLIDIMNRYLTFCPMSDYAIHTTVTQKGCNLSFIKNGSDIVFQINECPNIQCCYEELLEFIIEKAFPQ